VGWSKQGNKLEYKFPAYKGWGPSKEVIEDSGLFFGCQNIRIEGSRISSRGGWKQFSTGGTDITGLFGFNTDGGRHLVSVKQPNASEGILRKYDYPNSDWDATAQNYYRFLTAAIQDFTVAQNSDGKDLLIMTDGANNNLKWNMEDVALELTGKKIFDCETSEHDNWNTTPAETTNVRTGKYAVSIAATGGGTATNFVQYASVLYDASGGNDTTTLLRIGDISGVDREFAVKVNLTEEITFSKVSIDINVGGSPTGNLIIQCETDSAGLPSGTLIAASASNTAAGPTSDGWHTITLDSGDVTYGTSFWITINSNDDQSTGNYWLPKYDGVSGYSNAYSDDNGSTWATGVDYYKFNVRLQDAGDSLDLDTDYANGDEIVLWARLDGTAVDIDLTAGASYIEFEDLDTDTIRYVLDNETFVAGTWVPLVIPRQDLTTGDWTETGTINLATIAKVTILVDALATGTTNATVVFDHMYIRKTRVDSATGTKTRPAKGKYCEMSPHGDRLLVANTEVLDGDYNSGPAYIWFSDAYNIDNFTATQFVAMPEPITGMKTYGGLVHVFSKNARWIMKPTYSDAAYTAQAATGGAALLWEIAKAHGPGTVSNRSIAEGQLGKDNGLFFMAKNGIYFTNGMDAVRVDTDIDILFNRTYGQADPFYADMVDESNSNVATAICYKDRYFLSYYGNGDSDNEATVVLNTRTGGWERDVTSGAVDARVYTIGEDSNGLQWLYMGCNNGEIYEYYPHRGDSAASPTAVIADDGNAYQSDFQTPYIGLDVGINISWETLWLWIKAPTTAVKSIKVLMYQMEDFDDTGSYHEWEADTSTTPITVTTAFTPNTAFMWHRLRIDLDDSVNADYPTARGISFKIYDDNDTATDFILEKIVATQQPQND